MPFKASRETSDPEKAERVRFIEEPQVFFQSDPSTRPQLVQPKKSLLSRIISPEAIPWILTCVFASTTILLLLEQPESRRFGSYENRFTTDLKTLPQVPLEMRRFTGSPNFDKNGTMMMPEVDKSARWPENMRFTGEPSNEIDENWDDLLEGRYFSISEDEAIEAWGDRRHEFVDEEHGGYTAGLDVFHTLHCLNEVRMALHPEYYSRRGMAVETSPAHTAHCLDSIRQHIQCYGSTTLIPTKWRDSAQRQYIDTSQQHVCRDFGYLREFVSRRGMEGDLYVERDRSLISKVLEDEPIEELAQLGE